MNKQMRRAFGLCLALGTVGLVVGLARADDVDKMQGSWQVISVKVGKVVPPKSVLKDLQVIVDGNKFTLVEGAKREVVHFVLDPTAKPPSIEFYKNPTKADKLYHGIYQFEGGNLRLCWGPAGQERPHEFETSKSDQNRLYVLKKK